MTPTGTMKIEEGNSIYSWFVNNFSFGFLLDRLIVKVMNKNLDTMKAEALVDEKGNWQAQFSKSRTVYKFF